MSSTLVSFVRREVFETIPGMMCAFYRIPPSVGMEPQTLIVEDSHYYKPDIDGNQDAVFVPSAQIAQSVVDMHVRAQLGYRPDVAHPAIFAIPDREVTPIQAVKDYPIQVKKALDAQRQWFIELVRMADDDWRLAHRYQMVSDIQRTAATELGFTAAEKEWLDDMKMANAAKCPFCAGGLLNPDAPVCPNCKNVVNPVRFAEIEKQLQASLAKTVEKK